VHAMGTSRRIFVLKEQMDAEAGPTPLNFGLERTQCSSALLENVDAHTMEVFLDDQRELKATVFEVFKQHPALLVPNIEGLTKTEHRQLVRDSLRAILSAGFSPLQYFDSDIKKYIYMAEICAPIDLSLVRSPSSRRPDCATVHIDERAETNTAPTHLFHLDPNSVIMTSVRFVQARCDCGFILSPTVPCACSR
jgi:hypothetical protein